MKTLNRIMISSTLFAIISLFIILSAIGGLIFLFYSETNVGGFEIMDEEAIHTGTMTANTDTMDWEQLDKSVGELGYNLYVTSEFKPQKTEVVFSDLSKDQQPIVEKLKHLKLNEKALAARADNVQIIARQNGNYSIYAIKGTPQPSNLWKDFLFPLLTASIIVTTAILLLSLIFTRKMAWRVLRPLQALAEGAHRVEHGDYSTPIEHDSTDEFAEVCTAFNHMQEYLLSEREKNAIYEQARTEMITGISHDLRTPLTSVKGYIKGLKDGVAETKDKQEEYLSIAYKKACDMDVLLEKLFFFSKLETGNLPLNLSNHDLGKFAKQFVDEEELVLSQQDVKLSTYITPGYHTVKMDPQQMRRVLYNLVENSLHYANTESLKLLLSVKQNNDMVQIIFKDNGQGVCEDNLPLLFDRFWRGDESRNHTENEGSGLGLYIASYIIGEHKGSISALNDNGLTIIISLPAAVKEEENE